MHPELVTGEAVLGERGQPTCHSASGFATATAIALALFVFSFVTEVLRLDFLQVKGNDEDRNLF